MTSNEINQGIALVCETSQKIKEYYEDDQKLIDALNHVPNDQLKKCLEFYNNRNGVIIDLRKELIQELFNGTEFSVNDVYQLIAKHKEGKENQFKAYTKLFSMFFPPLTFYGHNEIRNFMSAFTQKLISDLGLEEQVAITSYDFQGPRQQGSDRYWVALYNKTQENQSSSLQMFIEFHHGKIGYGIYKHATKSYVKPQQQFSGDDFDYNQMLDYFGAEKQLIIDDVPDYSNSLKIGLNESRLYKMSHGTFKAKKYRHIIDTLKHNNWITIHNTTGKGQALRFQNDLKTGDYVYITLGSNELIGVARVISEECDFVPNEIIGDDNWLYREVEIIKPPIRKSPKPLKDTRSHFPSGNTTLAEVKPQDLDEANDLLFKPYFNVEFTTGTSSKLNDEAKEISLNNYKTPLNQIFFGPPGTGKTYHTILEAAKIVTNSELLTYNEALEVFNNELGKRIEFITFHQNYSYEDFIQGLRPDTESSNGELTFQKKNGVFKRIADKALKNLEDSENPASAKQDFSTVFNELIAPLNNEEKDEIEIKMKKTSFYITEVGEKSIEFRKNQGDSKHSLSIATLNKMYDKGRNDIILGGLQPYYNPILEVLLEMGKSSVASVQKQNYVIIIDEINRANISRVFGELITLIEKDKRSHGKIPLTTTLPSGDRFIVPSNLYIIGTMNTADKSIALLDIALRRRFAFVPMYPKYELEGDPTINHPDILQEINSQIISRKGHDFTIGHSYFMGDDYELRDTIDNKVLPLLLEYFMNDYDEVKKILAAANLKVDGWAMQLIDND